MNKILIVEASESDRRLMSGLLTRAGYEPIAVDKMEAAKVEVAKLPPGAVVVAAMKFTGGTAQELINWQKSEEYKFPVIAIVDNLNPSDLLELIRSDGAVDAIQRPAIDKQLVETVDKYVKPERIVIQLDNALIPRRSAKFREIEQAIGRIAETNANCIIFGESGMGKEQIARQIYLQSSRTQKPITVIEAGGAELVGLHDPKSDRNEMYNRIKSYFQNAAGGTIILEKYPASQLRETISLVAYSLGGTSRCEYDMHCQRHTDEDARRGRFPRQPFLYVAPVEYQRSPFARNDGGYSGHCRLSACHICAENITRKEAARCLSNQGTETASLARKHS